MADIRINSLSTTASSTASDDFLAVDGTTNGTRKLNAYSPTFGGNLTVSGTGSINGGSGSAAFAIKETASAGTALSLTNRNSTQTWGIAVDAAAIDDKLLAFISGGTVVLSLNATNWNATLAGNLTVSGASGITTTATNGAGLTHSTAAGSYRGLKLQTSSSDRWLIGANDAAESGSNAGSDLVVFSYSDAGTFLSSALKLVRSTGNLLLGTTTDSSNGKLQLTSHTTSAGGIGFGTDCTLYRSANNTLTVAPGAAAIVFDGGGSGTGGARILGSSGGLSLTSNTGHSLYLQTGGVIALTLDSSQNATFAGAVTVTKKISNDANTSISGDVAASVVNVNSGGYGLRVQGGASGSGYIISANDYSGSEKFQIAGNGNATFAGTIAIGNTVNTVSPTSPNRTITMVIGGTTYYLHAKTTND